MSATVREQLQTRRTQIYTIKLDSVHLGHMA